MDERMAEKDLAQKHQVAKKGTPALAVGLLLAALGWGLDGLAGFVVVLPIHTLSLALMMFGGALFLYALLRQPLGPRKALLGTGCGAVALLLALLLWSPLVLADIPMTPIPFSSGGRQHLVYEIRLRHYGLGSLQVHQVRVVDGHGRERGLFDAAFLGRGPMAAPPHPPLLLRAGNELNLNLWLDLAEGEGLPALLEHEIEWSQPEKGGSGQLLPGPTLHIEAQGSPVMIGPPLRGGPWMARSGPSNWSEHRRARVLGYLAQRFATDWVRVDEQGRSWKGAQQDNRSYFAYGDEVLAVAGGVVAEVVDGIPENLPPQQSVPVSLSTFAGNAVVLRLDKGLCAFYAHLQPGSLRVKSGQSVERGEVLGLVGNSGNSSEPHLHFHLANGCSQLRSEGVPYVYESYLSHGYFPYGTDFQLPSPQPRRRQLPLQSELVTFPD